MSTIDDVTQLELREVDTTGTLKASEKGLAELRKRKLIVQRHFFFTLSALLRVYLNVRKGQWFTVLKGPNFSTSIAKPETDLTVDMLTSYAFLRVFWFPDLIRYRGSWKNATFKKYNFEADGVPTSGGAFHPLLKVREEIRNIFLEMGYVNGLFGDNLLSNKHVPDSRKCQRTPLSNLGSGVLMRCSYHNCTQRENSKILSISQVCLLTSLIAENATQHANRSVDVAETRRRLLQACCYSTRKRWLRINRIPDTVVR